MKEIELKSLCEANLEFGTVIGSFTVDDSDSVNEMGSIGKIEYPHLYYVYIHPNEGMIPHFHVFDKEGMHKSEKNPKGFHTCVEIRRSKYFKHNAYVDSLDKATMKALDKFMRETRTSPKYHSDIGVSNFVHTINEWNDNNTKISNANYVDPRRTKQPDFTNITK